jgi:hypothetical protein
LEQGADINTGPINAENGEVRRYTRLDAAQFQLEMAVRALLQFDDPISALTLAGAAETVLSDLQPIDGIFGVDAWSIRAICNTHINTAHRKEAADLLRSAYNQLKHANKLPAHIHEIQETSVHIWLLLSIRAFTSLGGTASPILNAFKLWAMAARPEWISENDSPLIRSFAESSEWLRRAPKADAYRMILAAVESKSLVPNTQSLPSKSLIPNPKSLQEQVQP